MRLAYPSIQDKPPRRMHLKSLKIFCDIVRLGSFSKAAELNGVSQPNVSQLVHQLEERLGVKLIDRSRRPFVVTPEGKHYHQGCCELVKGYEQLENQVQTMHHASASRLTIAAIYSVGVAQMHRLVGEFRTTQPEVDLRVVYMHPDQVYEAVNGGEADLGIVSYARSTDRLQVMSWREETYAVAVPPNHRLATASYATAETLCGEPLVLPSPGLRVRDEINRFLSSHPCELKIAAEFDNLESIKRAVEVDEGIALLPETVFVSECTSGTLCRVRLEGTSSEPPLIRPLGIISPRDSLLSEAAEGFMQLLKEHASDPPDDVARNSQESLTSQATA